MSTLTPPTPALSPSAPTPSPGSVPADIVINEAVRIPAFRDLPAFRLWARSDARPPQGRFSYIEGTIWIDLTMEQGYSHNDVKAEIASVLRGITRRRDIGRYFTDGMLLTTPAARLSTVPDGMLVLFDSLEAGRIVEVPNQRQVGAVEFEGVADMVLEVVSDSSVEKDTVTLPRLYHGAGVRELWIADARNELRFEIFRRGDASFQPTVLPDGWWRSELFGHEFRLVRDNDRTGRPRFTLEHR